MSCDVYLPGDYPLLVCREEIPGKAIRFRCEGCADVVYELTREQAALSPMAVGPLTLELNVKQAMKRHVRR